MAMASCGTTQRDRKDIMESGVMAKRKGKVSNTSRMAVFMRVIGVGTYSMYAAAL